MRKTLFTLLALTALSLSGFAQRNVDMRLVNKALHPQSLRAMRNDIAPQQAIYHENEDAIVRYRDTFSYDEYEYYLATVTTEFEDLGSWQPYAITTYEYDYNLMPIEILTQEYEGNGYVNDEKITIQYEGDFEPLVQEELIEEWENNSWRPERKSIYTYDPTLTILVRDWNGNALENHYLYTIEESFDGQTVLKQYWQGGAWQNEELVEITYNSNQEVSQTITKEWEGETWVNELKKEYSYAGPYQLFKIVETEWNNGQWDSNRVKIISYEYNSMGSTHAVCTATYGDNNTDIEMFYNEGESIVYEDVCEVTMSYIDVSGLHEVSTDTHFTVMPNPSTDLIEVTGAHFQRVELYSMSGQKVAESLSPQLVLKGLASGTYVVKVYNDNGAVESHKLVVR